ncbi:uncharacterized protein [Parasteatoda tepidariorum]|uniref:uncharacterized protein n=1 Tax=Parasteatoda tepidariorum TaxID=114398 RepID=UPI0039BC31B5
MAPPMPSPRGTDHLYPCSMHVACGDPDPKDKKEFEDMFARIEHEDFLIVAGDLKESNDLYSYKSYEEMNPMIAETCEIADGDLRETLFNLIVQIYLENYSEICTTPTATCMRWSDRTKECMDFLDRLHDEKKC